MIMPMYKVALSTVTAVLLAGAAFSIVTAQGDGGEEDDKITICHIPPGNPDAAHTIEIGRPAWQAHESHGDTEGPCPGDVEAGADSGDGNETEPESNGNETEPEGNETEPEGNQTEPEGNETEPEGNQTEPEPEGNETEPEPEDDGFGTQEVPPCHHCPAHAADVGVNKSGMVTEGEGSHDDRVDYRIIVESVGEATASNVTLYDELPDFGGTWVLGGNDAEDCELSDDDVVTCDFGDLEPGESRSIVTSTALCELGCEAVTNTAVVNATNDSDPSNNEDSFTVDPECPEPEPETADVGVDKTVNVTESNETGMDQVNYTIVTTSLGNATAENVTLSDELPDLDTTWSVGGPDAEDCSLDNNTLACDFGDLASGESRTIFVESALCELECEQEISNTAFVAADNDSDASNDNSTATFTTEDCPEADVGVSKEGIVVETGAQDQVTWNITVESLGDATAENVTLHDELPEIHEGDNTSYTLGGANADDCTLDGRTLTCDFGDLAPGEVAQVTATSELCHVGCGPDIENTATIAADNDTDASNNEATAVIEREDCE